MAKEKNGPRKRRTRGHIIADLAVNHVERHVLRCGYTMHRIVHDYGLDAIITTYSKEGEFESAGVWLQIKATDNPRRLRDSSIPISVERKHLLAWIRELYPVILVVYDGLGDRAFWLHIQGELAGGKIFELARLGAVATLHVPVNQVVNEAAIRQWRRLKEERLTPW